jgi:hypothetical protein
LVFDEDFEVGVVECVIGLEDFLKWDEHVVDIVHHLFVVLLDTLFPFIVLTEEQLFYFCWIPWMFSLY